MKRDFDYYNNYMKPHILTVFVLLSSTFTISSLIAQERAAAGALDTQVSWTALKNLIDQANASSSSAHARIDQVVVCGKAGMLYAPETPGANAQGCVRPQVTTQNTPVNCEWYNLPQGSKHLICPSNKVIMGLAYENDTWSRKTDSHAAPEIYSAMCCTLHPAQ